MSEEEIKELGTICFDESCSIDIQKEKSNIDLNVSGDSRVILLTLFSVINILKERYDISDEVFQTIMILSSKIKEGDKNEENSINN